MTIIDSAGAKPAIEERVKQIRAQIENTTYDYGREKLRAAGEADARRGSDQSRCCDRVRDEGEEGARGAGERLVDRVYSC